LRVGRPIVEGNRFLFISIVLSLYGMPPKRKKTLQTIQLPGIAIETQDPAVVKKHIAGVVALSFVTKLFTVVLTVGVFSSFVDFFDISLYYGYATQVLAGKIPFLDFSIEYPVLFLVPVLLPLIFTLGTANPMVYILGYIGIMAVFDALIAACVYLAALRLYQEKTAFLCGILSATAFSAGYFAITKYDAFPTFLLVTGILFVLYGAAGKGYAAIALGFLAKIFPLLALPPALLHASAATSVREELRRAAKVCLPLPTRPISLPQVPVPVSTSIRRQIPLPSFSRTSCTCRSAPI